MFQLIYIEKAVREHPEVKRVCHRYASTPQVIIERYGEVFNRKGQNFRVQKRHPALILAKKKENWILPTPPTYGIGTPKNYYFSHLLNCPFDCRYCFLQGMFSSAHYVHFVNDADFKRAIESVADSQTTFFTGYDCDSLAFEGVTGFAKQYLPFMANSEALFEFRTKSTQITPFLELEPLPKVVIAFTLTPHEEKEHRAPSLKSRLEAMQLLQKKGWQLGIRFDPMIYEPGYRDRFPSFFHQVFSQLQEPLIHSVSLGAFRVPPQLFKKMVKLYPKEPLFAQTDKGNEEMLSFCSDHIINYIPKTKFFPCDVQNSSCNRSESGNRKGDQPQADC